MRLFLFILITSISFNIIGQRSNIKNDSITKELIKKSLIDKKRNGEKDFSTIDFNIVNEINDLQSGGKLVYVCQKHNGIEIFNAISTFTIHSDLVRFSTNRFRTKFADNTVEQKSTLAINDVYNLTLNKLGLDSEINLKIESANGKQHIITGTGEKIQFKLMYFQNDEDLILVWKFDVKDFKNNHWWDLCVDANNGDILFQKDRVLNCHFSKGDQSDCNLLNENHLVIENESNLTTNRAQKPSYFVFPLPYESPVYTSRVLTYNPYENRFSPNGWHEPVSQNGLLTTKGNNVYAYEDSDANNTPSATPTSDANFAFNFAYDDAKTPSTYRDAAITQLFYINNMIHDITYAYGFDEESGNFQDVNFTSKGVGNDAVNAEGQDGSGVNNANFATPPDGQNPRMQMFIFNTSAQSNLLSIDSPISLKSSYLALPAAFGPLVYSPISNKELVLYNDNTAPNQNDGCETPAVGSNFNGKIVLIKRGNCKFYDKVKNAQENGAIAVIIMNNSDNPIISMGGSGDSSLDQTIEIPSIMISQTDGNLLIDYLNKNKLTVTLASPPQSQNRDSNFDNGIIIHEYTHGISNRLTGGPANTSCLYNDEQMGEGWSDYFALMLTLKANDFNKDYRAMGLFAIGQDTISGRGIRPAPYSTNFKVNPYTYDDVKDTVKISMPHGIGFIWATILWDMTTSFVNKYGYDNDLINGIGGNNKALKLVTYAMKLQPCNPGFVDGRDAILLADELLFNGENKHIIWCAFAKRGVGLSANQGSSSSRLDQVAAFDLPKNLTLNIVSCGPYLCSIDNKTYTKSGTYTISAPSNCNISHTLNLEVNSSIDNSIELLEGNLYKAIATNLKYQWLDCNNNSLPLEGEVRQFFKPKKSGNYAVRINNDLCTVTSDCFNYSALSLNTQDILSNINIYPNPTADNVRIEFHHKVFNLKINLLDVTGKVVYENQFIDTDTVDLTLNLEPGTYQLEISDNFNYNVRHKILIVR